MLTRSASQNSSNNLNSSRGRGKPVTPNFISLDSPSTSASTRSRVIHTPPPIRSRVNLPGTLDQASSIEQVTTNLLDTSVQDLSQASFDELLAPLGFIEKQSRTNEYLVMATNRDNAGSNQIVNSEVPVTHNVMENSMQTLIEEFRRTVGSYQQEMRSELNAMKQTLSGVIAHQETSTCPSPPFSNPVTDQSSNFRPNNNEHNTTNIHVDLEKWKLHFDGSDSVSEFLFKVDTLRERSRCSETHLMANFHVFLSGKADSWFWRFVKQHPESSFSNLKQSLKNEFGSLETDHEVLLRISSRKQQAKESYDDFHDKIVAMNCRMKEPIADMTLIDILKRNVNGNLKIMLFNTNPKNLHDLRDLARNAEKLLQEGKLNVSLSSVNRQINEIDMSPNEDVDTDVEFDPQIEAMQLTRRKPDYSKIKCWNCLLLGHSYIYCPDDTRHLFCFKCGQRGVNTTKCINPHPGNRNRSEMATGDSRSKSHTPSPQ